MNNTSAVASLARRAGKWTILGAIVALSSIAASSCLKEDDNSKGGDDTAAAGSGNEDDDAAAGRTESGLGDDDDSNDDANMSAVEGFVDACGDKLNDDEMSKLLACGAAGEEAQQLKVNMLVVLDKSGSMNNVPDGYDQSLWESVKSALQAVIEDSKHRINYAMELYPFPANPAEPIQYDCTDNCCEMPETSEINVGFDEAIEAASGEAPEDSAVKRIEEALDDAEPGGGTPTAEALRRAHEYLQAANLDGNTYILLATDGGPNCNADTQCERNDCTMHIDGYCKDEDEDINCCLEVPTGCVDSGDTLEAIQDLADDGINTYVVGIPGSEPYEPYLNDFAVAGQVPNEDPDDPEAPSYYRVSESGGASALLATFKKITEQLVTSCKIRLASAPPDIQRVNVAVNCVLLPQEDADGNIQWDFESNNTVIRIQGDECDDIEANGARRVDVLQGCPVIGVQ